MLHIWTCRQVQMPGDNCLIAFVVPLKGPMGMPKDPLGFHPPSTNITSMRVNITDLVPNVTAKNYMELRFDDHVKAGTLGGQSIDVTESARACSYILIFE